MHCKTKTCLFFHSFVLVFSLKEKNQHSLIFFTSSLSFSSLDNQSINLSLFFHAGALTCSHCPSTLSFHRLTAPLESETASTPPAVDHDTRQTGCPEPKSLTSVGVQVTVRPSSLQTKTLPSWPAEASTGDGDSENEAEVEAEAEEGEASLGAKATSLTHSLCADSGAPSAIHPPALLSSNRHSLTRLSQPQVARRFSVVEGNQETPRTPAACALSMRSALHPSHELLLPLLLLWAISTETLPSELAAASASPSSCGANASAFTDAECAGGSKGRRCHVEAPPRPPGLPLSTQSRTRWSNEAEARSPPPKRGWAQATAHTGPSWPESSASWVTVSPATSKIWSFFFSSFRSKVEVEGKKTSTIYASLLLFLSSLSPLSSLP